MADRLHALRRGGGWGFAALLLLIVSSARGAEPADPLHAKPPVAAVGKIFVPDFIKPGARLIYQSGSSIEDRGPGKPESGGVGMTRMDVIAVADDRVLMLAGTFLGGVPGDGRAPRLAASNAVTVTSAEVDGGQSFWISKEGIATLRAATGAGVTVVEAPWKLDSGTYDAVSLTRLGNDSAVRTVFDTRRGLLLSQQNATGPRRRNGPDEPFNREVNGFLTFQTFRQLDLPWVKAAPPTWALRVKTMRYEGAQTLSLAGAPPISSPFTATIQITARGEGWVTGTLKRESPAGPPTTEPYVGGPGQVGHNWINPAALAAMKEGDIDHDPTLRSTLRYAVQDGPQGRLGVLIETGEENGYQRVWGYDLKDGALVFGSSTQTELNTKTEYHLTGRE